MLDKIDSYLSTLHCNTNDITQNTHGSDICTRARTTDYQRLISITLSMKHHHIISATE